MHREQKEALIAEAERVAKDADGAHFVASLEYLTARQKMNAQRSASERAKHLVRALKATLAEEEAPTPAEPLALKCRWCKEEIVPLPYRGPNHYVHSSGPQGGFEACERDMQSCVAAPAPREGS